MKTTEHTGTPSTSEQLANGDGVLQKAASGAHYAVERAAGAAEEGLRKAIPAIERAAEYAHRTVDKAAIGATPAAEWLDDQATAINATKNKIVSGTRAYVTANPLASLGIAIAAGFLVSRMLRK